MGTHAVFKSILIADNNEIEIGFRDDLGEPMMLDKKERKLVTLLLIKTMTSKSGRTYITEKLGQKYVDIGEKLLSELGGDELIGSKK